MRLLSVELQGYKRFLKRTKLKVGGKVTALVGPNEAGKSSILEALAGAFSKDWAEHSVNWAVKQQSDLVDGERAEVVMHFSIDDGDRTRLQHLPLVALPRRMTVRKTVYGVSMSFEPPAQWTDQRPFVRQLYADMERLGRVFKRRSDIDQGFEQEKFQRLEYVLNHQHQFLPSVLVDDTIQPDGIEGLRYLLSYLETSLPVLAAEILGEGEPDVLSKVVSSLARLAFFSESEVTAILENLRQLNQMLPYFKETPEATVYRYLGAGIPTPILFKPADYLPPSVAILQRKTPDEEDPATARLRLLLKVAEVNFDHLVDLLERGHGSGARAELVQGERRLNQGLLAAWPFSDLQVRVHLEGQTITLELMEAGTGHLIPLGVRSAGAQFFLSLFVFLNHFTGPVTGASWIILIDEIEQHLHVDAQRSIVEGLERQAMVGQVIYTTHSPFALPADLTAIRSVEPDVPGGTSRIHNKVWADRQTNKREGLERLFTMMGASVGMFNAARAALVTEGETDLVLLPKLLAEALGLSHFPAITLPGFAAGSQHKLAFEQEGVRVAYLFDGDQQGRDYQKTLLRELGKTYGVNPDFKPSGGSSWEANVRPEDKARVLTLAEGCDLEDYLHPDFYLAGIQAHIENQGLQLPVPTIQDLGTQDRPASLKAWAEKHGVKPSQMGKMDIVEQLLDLWPEYRIHVDPARHAEFEEIARQVCTALGLEKLLERRLF